MRPLAVAVTLVLSAGEARAERCGPGDLEQDPAERARRIAYLDATLERERALMSRWVWGWGLGFAGVAAGQVGLGLAISDEGRSIDLYVSATKAGIGALYTAVNSPRVRPARIELGDTSCAALAAAEEALFAGARAQRRGSGLLVRGGSLVVNAGAVLYLGLAHDRWGSGLLGAAVGLAVGEVKIYTQPSGAIAAARRYRDGDPRGAPTGRAFGVGPGPAGSLGLSLGGTF
jgi:hypothetical protein